MRLGLGADLPVGRSFRFTSGAALCDGYGNWAEGVPLYTLDEELRAGLVWQWPVNHRFWQHSTKAVEIFPSP